MFVLKILASIFISGFVMSLLYTGVKALMGAPAPDEQTLVDSIVNLVFIVMFFASPFIVYRLVFKRG
jgi:hypothetical protein